VGSARAAITHVGYLIGSTVGGGAIAIGGRSGVGIVFGLLLLSAAIPYWSMWAARCERPSELTVAASPA
jgi:predicted MFS family arabinose efflux permease